MSALGIGAFLLAVWLLLWGSVSVANVLSGLVVVAAVLAFVPDARFPLRRPTVRLRPALAFVAWVLVDLVRSNLVVAREILTPDTSINTGVIEVPLPHCSPGLLTLVANTVALAPGSMVIEVDRDPGSIYVHVLHLDSVAEVQRQVLHLSALAVRAFGSDEAVAALEALDALDEGDDPVLPEPGLGGAPREDPS